MKISASFLSVAYDAFLQGEDDLASELIQKGFESDDASELMDALDTVAEDEDTEEEVVEEEPMEEDLEEEPLEEEEEAPEEEEEVDLSDAPAQVKAKIRSIANRIASRDNGKHVDLAYRLLNKIS